jgi:hypothetical protein
MGRTARPPARPFSVLIEPLRCLLAHQRLTQLALGSHVYRLLDGPPRVRTGDASQEAFDAAVDSEAEARVLRLGIGEAKEGTGAPARRARHPAPAP